MKTIPLQALLAVANKPETDPAFELLVDMEGGRAAGWLAWQFRKAFKTTGVVEFNLPKSKTEDPELMWYRVALAEFRRREERWHVEVVPHLLYEKVRVWWKPKMPTSE